MPRHEERGIIAADSFSDVTEKENRRRGYVCLRSFISRWGGGGGRYDRKRKRQRDRHDMMSEGEGSKQATGLRGGGGCRKCVSLRGALKELFL